MITKIHFIPLIQTLFINSLFIYKYSHWIGILPSLSILTYICFVVFLLYFIDRFTINSHFQKRLSFAVVIGVGSICFSLILLCVPPNMFAVDRWSAITNFNNALLGGRFPYNELSHLNNPISGLPGLFLVAFPFQIGGDAGFLQVFSFICFGILAYCLIPKPEEGILLLSLLMMSPSFFWEVLARSELFSNMILVLLVIIYFDYNRHNKTKLKIIIGAVFLGIILSTRMVILIPFLLYFIKYFYKNETSLVSIFLIITLLSFSATICPFAIWNWDAFIKQNPLVSQTDKAPIYFSITFCAITILSAFRIKNIKKCIYISGLLLFFLAFSTFVYQIFNFGWTGAIYQNHFDISYFQLALPFLLLSIYDVRDMYSTHDRSAHQHMSPAFAVWLHYVWI